MTRDLLKKFFNMFGLEVYYLQPYSDTGTQLIKAMQIINTELVFDIGANAGQFASEIRRKGYEGKIVSFEPLSSTRDKLLKKSSRDKKWIIHEQTALGEKHKNIEINISKNSVSSSILPMLKSHYEVDNNSVFVGSETVPLITLDSVAKIYLERINNSFIKIDTQGYEWQVLDGARETLKVAKGIYCELSLIPLYKDQHLWKAMIERIEKEGFTLWSLQQGLRDPQSGRTLQMDAIFLKLK